jgi:sulfur relay (sulfurtransferase) DsrC/TusE family protein
MAEDGVLSLVFKVDTKTKDLVGNIQIESRGFVYSGEVQKVHTDIVEYSKKRYYTHLKVTTDVKMILRMIKDELGIFIEKNIGRIPMLMPMFVYINRDGATDGKSDEAIGDETIVGMSIDEPSDVQTHDYDAPVDTTSTD